MPLEHNDFGADIFEEIVGAPDAPPSTLLWIANGIYHCLATASTGIYNCIPAFNHAQPESKKKKHIS